MGKCLYFTDVQQRLKKILYNVHDHKTQVQKGFPGGTGNLPANTGDIRGVGFISGLGGSPGGRHGNPLQYSCLKNPIDRGAWQVTAHSVTKSQT